MWEKGMFKGKVNLGLVMIVTLGLSACASTEPKTVDPNVSGISGTYDIEVTYGKDLAQADYKWFFGRNPDIEFILTQKGDKITGEFAGDRDGTILKGKVDDKEVTFEFVLDAMGGELKEGAGTWNVQEDGSLKGDFNIRDQKLGIVMGLWILTRIE
jgi:hypothetical protein